MRNRVARVVPVRFVATLAVTLLAVLSSTFTAFPLLADNDWRETHERGRSYAFADQWFQYLGCDADGQDLWLYPHLDGVHEVFTAVHGSRRWEGDLESRFHPTDGKFERRFSAVEVLNEFLHPEAPRAHRKRAARLLALFHELHGGDEPPFYLARFWRKLEKRLGDEGREWVRTRAARQRERVARVRQPGTRLPYLPRRLAWGGTHEDYYQHLIADGYLDIALIGGNLKNNDTGDFSSMQYMAEMLRALESQGFKRLPFRHSVEPSLLEKSDRILGFPVRVRIRITGGSQRSHRIRRGVANFVEGFAHADVVIYHGHSNRTSGAYYASETMSDWSRFQIGLDDQRDLHRKCHGLASRPYQILALQSCSSYEKYCRPVRWHYEEHLRERAGVTGFMGTADLAYFTDFVPRYSRFIELLLEGTPPRQVHQELNAIRSQPATPPLVLRALLQPRFSFIVPQGVEIEGVDELAAREANLVVGTGSDGRRYWSCEIFPQDRVGDVVQVAHLPEGVYALLADGQVYFAGPRTDGASVVSFARAAASKQGPGGFEFIAPVAMGGKRPRLHLIGRDGRIYVARHRTQKLGLASRQPPRDRWFTAIGNDSAGRMVAADWEGTPFRWAPDAREWVQLDEAPELEGVSPSLTGHGIPGRVWLPDRPGDAAAD